jgi:hypothetical protein
MGSYPKSVIDAKRIHGNEFRLDDLGGKFSKSGRSGGVWEPKASEVLVVRDFRELLRIESRAGASKERLSCPKPFSKGRQENDDDILAPPWRRRHVCRSLPKPQ